MLVCLLQASDHLGFIFAIAMFILEASITRERESGEGRRKSKRGRETKCYKLWEEKKAPATEAASQVTSSEVCSELCLLHLVLC